MNKKTKGIFLILFSAISFSFMATMVKLLPDIPTFEKVFFRNLVSLIIALLGLGKSIKNPFGSIKSQKFLILRSTFGLLGVMLFFYSINNMILADSAILNKLSPFFVTIFAIIFLGEKINRAYIIGFFIVFLGVLMVIKPRFDFSILPAIAGLMGSFFAGGAYTMLRVLRNFEKPATIVFYFSFFSVIVMFPLMMLNFKAPNMLEFLYLISTGIFAAIGQFSITYAYRLAEASKISIFNYTSIIFSAIIGFFILNEIPDNWSLFGGTLIIAVSVFLFFDNHRKKIN